MKDLTDNIDKTENIEPTKPSENKFEEGSQLQKDAPANVEKSLEENALSPKEDVADGRLHELSPETQENLASFNEANWENMDADAREEKCKDLYNSACDDMGVSKENRPELRFVSDEEFNEKCSAGGSDPENTKAFYLSDDHDKAVYMKQSDLENPDVESSDLANTVGHEARHVYQREAVDDMYENGLSEKDAEYGFNCDQSFRKDKEFTEQDADNYGNQFSDWLEDN